MAATEWGEIADPTEQVSTPSEAAAKLVAVPPALARGTAQAAQHPLTTAQSIMEFAKRNAIPTGMMGAATGGLDLALPEGGIPLTIAEMLLKAGASGAANVAATKELPPSLGGEPSMPVGRSFLYGAMGEPIAGAPGIATRLAERRLGNVAEQAASRGVKSLDPQALTVQDRLLAGKANLPFPDRLAGNQLTDATDTARSPVYQTIRSARQRYGAWLNQAYDSLKGQPPIEEDDAIGMADSAQAAVQGMKAPGPLTRRFAAQMEQWKPKKDLGIEHRDIELPGGTWVHHGPIADKPPPTPDQLREMWQQLGQAQGKAEAANNGAEANGLGQLRDILEENLNDRLGPEWAKQRNNYRGFIRRWNYRDQAQLWHLDTPQQVADWTFEKPEYAHDLLAEAQGNRAALNQIRSLFVQHVYGPLNNTTMTRLKQLSEVQKRLDPYVKDNTTAQMLFGRRGAQAAREMVGFARFSGDFKDRYERDAKFSQSFQQGIQQELLRSGMPVDQAANAVLRQIALANPELGATDQDVLRQLPPPPEAKANKSVFASRMPFYHGAMLGLGLGSAALTHKMGFGVAWQGTALASWLLLDAGSTFKGASRLGIVRPILLALKSSNGNMAGRIAARAFLNLGQRQLQEMDVERNAP